jgi:UDP-N-acetylenolpyruvoylglucosamine reductase
LKGKTVIRENEDYVWVRKPSRWLNLFFGLSTKFFGGLENILIPGNVGTTPVQKYQGHMERDQGYVCFL